MGASSADQWLNDRDVRLASSQNEYNLDIAIRALTRILASAKADDASKRIANRALRRIKANGG